MDLVDNKPKQKFTLLCRGFSIDNGEPLIDCFQIQEGKFPVRYLGVPLISKRLTADVCNMLIEKAFHK
jgi:hypothetical protein